MQFVSAVIKSFQKGSFSDYIALFRLLDFVDQNNVHITIFKNTYYMLLKIACIFDLIILYLIWQTS